MHPGRSSAKHRRAGKVRQSDARHTRKGQRCGVGVGEGGSGLAGEVVGRVSGHFIAITILNLLVGRSDVDMVVRVVSRVNRNLIDRPVVLIVRKRRGWLLFANEVREGLGSTTASGVSLEFVKLIELVLNRVEAQELRVFVVGFGLNRLGLIELVVIRKLERKPLSSRHPQRPWSP